MEMEMDGTYSIDPWKRKLTSEYDSDDEIEIYQGCIEKAPRFLGLSTGFDIYTKRAVLKIAPSVVALVSYSGDKELCRGCGTIIEADNDNNMTLITSANLVRRPTAGDMVLNHLADNLKVHVIVAPDKTYQGEIAAYDFHYNILVLRFESSSPLPTARISYINDCLSLSMTEQKPFELRPHSANLTPGDTVFVVGRYQYGLFDIAAAPGIFCMDRCILDCKELCLTTCITYCWHDGAPLINLSGEVVGIAFYSRSGTLFLPINIVLKWWENYKSHGKCCRLSLGFDAANLYAADLPIIERVLKRFPNIWKGVIVEKVKQGSSAHLSGLLKDDIIVQCGDRKIESFLELFETLWMRVGDSVELVVARANQETLLHLNLTVAEANPGKLNSWPRGIMSESLVIRATEGF